MKIRLQLKILCSKAHFFHSNLLISVCTFDLSGLDVEGIFRKSPSKVQEREIKGRFDAGETAGWSLLGKHNKYTRVYVWVLCVHSAVLRCGVFISQFSLLVRQAHNYK